MWNSDPQRFPDLTNKEANEALMAARKRKGQELFKHAYAKNATGVREFPVLNAKRFGDWIQQRGNARAQDQHWPSGQYDIDADNKAVLKLLALYFTRDPRFSELTSPNGKKYSLYKGIYVSGPTGVGKTHLMELCGVNPHACFTRHDCQVIANEYTDKKEGGQPVIDFYSANSDVSNTDLTFGHTYTGRFFDDLGQEEIGNHYGNIRNVMAQIIESRYRSGGFFLTHFTSNHTLDQLGPLYGSRVPDRLQEMCNVIEFPATAKSRRG